VRLRRRGGSGRRAAAVRAGRRSPARRRSLTPRSAVARSTQANYRVF